MVVAARSYPPRAEYAPARPSPAPRPVVVVDDDSFTARLITHCLGPRFAVTWINDGKQALDVIRRERPALVTIDYVLPGLDGLALSRKIRREAPDVRIVIVTAFPGLGDEAAASGLTVDGFLAKPFGPAQLQSLVDQILAG